MRLELALGPWHPLLRPGGIPICPWEPPEDQQVSGGTISGGLLTGESRLVSFHCNDKRFCDGWTAPATALLHDDPAMTALSFPPITQQEAEM